MQGGIAEAEEVLSTSIDGSKATDTKVLLILDGIDFLLGATEAGVKDVLDTIGELREVGRPSLLKHKWGASKGIGVANADFSMSTQPSSLRLQTIHWFKSSSLLSKQTMPLLL